jgi:hypothetical protein
MQFAATRRNPVTRKKDRVTDLELSCVRRVAERGTRVAFAPRAKTSGVARSRGLKNQCRKWRTPVKTMAML